MQRSYYLHSNRDTSPGPPCPPVAPADGRPRPAPQDPEGGGRRRDGAARARRPAAQPRRGGTTGAADDRRGGTEPRVLAAGRGRAQVRRRLGFH